MRPKFKIITIGLSEYQVNTTSHSKQQGQFVGQMEMLWIFGTQFTLDSIHHLVFAYI